MGRERDQLDRQILACLKEDGRIASLEISRRLRVTEKTVRARISRLMNDGVRITAEDTAGTRMLIGLSTEPGRRMSTATRLADSLAVDHVYLTTGAFDVLVQASFDSDIEAIEFLAHEIEAIEGVREVHASHLM